MTDIQFYHLTTTPLERALPKLLEKAITGGFRALVLVKDEEAAEKLNAALWTYDPGSFLPHGSKKDGRAEQQPIYITHEAENPNGANLLVVTDGSPIDPLDGFARLIDIFDGSAEDAAAAAQKRLADYRAAGHSVSAIRQTANGWAQEKAA